MIRSFRDQDTQRFYGGERIARFETVKKVAWRKFDMLNAAANLDDLRSPPGNRLEALAGDRAGQYSIRVNDQWRLCFVWTDEGPAEVELSKHYRN